MKAIWDKGEDISISELAETLKTKYNKDYNRTSIATFILNLSAKGYAVQYRKGRYAYVHALKSEKDHKEKLLQEHIDFWYQGDATKIVAALRDTGKMTPKAVQQVRGLLNDLDN